MFSEYNDKIIHIVHDHNATLENGPRDDGLPSAWNNEKEQRFYGTKGISQLNLTDNERNAVIAFIRTLAGNDVYTNTKWSNPFIN